MDALMLVLTAIASAGAVTMWVRWWLERGHFEFEIQALREHRMKMLRNEAGDGAWLTRLRSLSNRTITGVTVQGLDGVTVHPRSRVATRLDPDEESPIFSVDIDDDPEAAWILIAFRPQGSAWLHMTWLPLSPSGELAAEREHQETRAWWRTAAARIATGPMPSPLSVAAARVRSGTRGTRSLQEQVRRRRRRGATRWARVLLRIAAGGRRSVLHHEGEDARS